MTLYVVVGMECLELTVVHGTVESLWIRIKGQINNADVTVGVLLWISQTGQVHQQISLLRTKDAFKSTSCVLLLGDFSLPEIKWENHIGSTV